MSLGRLFSLVAGAPKNGVRSTLPTLFLAISDFEIEADLKTLHKPLMESLQILVAKFLQSVVTPVATHRFEQDTEDVEAMSGSVKYRDNSYRPMRDKTKHSQILECQNWPREDSKYCQIAR